jgi:hypothetical protein
MNRFSGIIWNLVVLLVLVAFTPGHAQSQQVGSWSYQTNTDAITDKTQEFAMVLNESGQSLVGMCLGNDRYFVANFKDFMNSRGETSKLIYRIDGGDVEERWAKANSTTIGVLDGNAQKMFEDLLAGADEIVVRARDYNGKFHTAFFSLEGAAEAINKLTCFQGR